MAVVAVSYVTEIFDKYIALDEEEPFRVTTIFPVVALSVLLEYVEEEVVRLPLFTEEPPTLISYVAVVAVV